MMDMIEINVPAAQGIDSMLLLAFAGEDSVITLLDKDVTYYQRGNAAKTLINNIACSRLSVGAKTHLLRMVRDYASLVIDIAEGR